MCNTVTIHYSCNHFAQFHRSTCRSTIWVTRTCSKTKNSSRSRLDNKDSDAETPDRGRTLERRPSKTSPSPSPSPSSSQSRSHSPAPKLVTKAACKSLSVIVLRTQQRCGPCQRTFKRGFLQIRRARQDLPARKKRKHLKRGRPISGGSPLKHELTVEDLLRAEDEIATDLDCAGTMNSTTQTVNGIARLLHLEPARFWRCWRRFDGVGRRYVDLIKG
ncbi:unnamed protein product [Aureobasidium uvarum]|uniref:Uncharacterized protein n=1 Tax=Aureobasidium uvarum TaxID=2773716 RepID=A0A9N8KHR7_9PEZI|nr:unnamed protein product [Aureobasidium uvarum]